MLRGLHEEDGQVIILFVFVFTIFLVVAAFAIDQGFWYGRRRVVQKDADLAARAGALAYLTNLSNYTEAKSRAEETAAQNGASGIVTGKSGANCPNMNGAPFVTVEIEGGARRFFSGLPLVSGEPTPVQIDAVATACVFGVSGLQAGNSVHEDDADNTLKAIPIAIRSNAPQSPPSFVVERCFNAAGEIQLGVECVIFGSKAPPSGTSSNTWARRRILFTDPGPSGCRGNGSVTSSFDEIEDGLEMSCEVSGGSCTNTTCIRGEDINEDENAERVLDAIENRLDDGDDRSDCESGGQPEASFINAFRNAPAALGGSGGNNEAYIQSDCFGNPRIVLLPIVDNSEFSSSQEHVRGFATVYITGCYDVNDSSTVMDRQTNECDGDWDVFWCDRPFGLPPSEDCFIEVRAIPFRMLLTEEVSVGGLVQPTENSPLTIQTVK